MDSTEYKIIYTDFSLSGNSSIVTRLGTPYNELCKKCLPDSRSILLVLDSNSSSRFGLVETISMTRTLFRIFGPLQHNPFGIFLHLLWTLL